MMMMMTAENTYQRFELDISNRSHKLIVSPSNSSSQKSSQTTVPHVRLFTFFAVFLLMFYNVPLFIFPLSCHRSSSSSSWVSVPVHYENEMQINSERCGEDKNSKQIESVARHQNTYLRFRSTEENMLKKKIYWMISQMAWRNEWIIIMYGVTCALVGLLVLGAKNKTAQRLPNYINWFGFFVCIYSLVSNRK